MLLVLKLGEETLLLFEASTSSRLPHGDALLRQGYYL